MFDVLFQSHSYSLRYLRQPFDKGNFIESLCVKTICPCRPSQILLGMIICNPYWIIKCANILFRCIFLSHLITVSFADLIFTSLIPVFAVNPKSRHLI